MGVRPSSIRAALPSRTDRRRKMPGQLSMYAAKDAERMGLPPAGEIRRYLRQRAESRRSMRRLSSALQAEAHAARRARTLCQGCGRHRLCRRPDRHFDVRKHGLSDARPDDGCAQRHWTMLDMPYKCRRWQNRLDKSRFRADRSRERQ